MGNSMTLMHNHSRTIVLFVGSPGCISLLPMKLCSRCTHRCASPIAHTLWLYEKSIHLSQGVLVATHLQILATIGAGACACQDSCPSSPPPTHTPLHLPLRTSLASRTNVE